MAKLSADETQAILNYPVSEALEPFRHSFHSTCDKLGVAKSPESVKEVVSSKEVSRVDLSPHYSVRKQLKNFPLGPRMPLCRMISRPYTLNFASSVRDTPNSFSSGGFKNTSEPALKVRDVLRWELNSSLELDHRDFITTFLAENAQVEDAATTVFDKCREGDDPLYKTGDGWRDWEGHNESGVQRSMEGYISIFTTFLDKADIKPPSQRRFVTSPNTPIPGSVKRKPDLCFAKFAEESNGTPAKTKQQIASWREVLVAFELKSAGKDRLESTWLDMVKYAREIFRHQDSRRFVLGLTLCGSTMRLWGFDRLGATTSQPFDIHKNGLMFVTVLLGFLWMDDEQLGLDPDLMEVDGQRFVKINRDGKEERLIITDTLRDHAPCIVGRATTCWKAYREGDESKKPLVVKDSWQYVDRPEEGELVRKATAARVINISPYYHHETASMPTTNHLGKPRKPEIPKEIIKSDRGITTATKALAIYHDGQGGRESIGERQSPSSYHHAERHESSLNKANVLHRDISTGNILLDEDESDGFLNDFDLAVDITRLEASGAPGKTGTKVFMAIGVLLDEPHSFMHDLESFFWVLFWICIHYTGPGKEGEPKLKFEKWNYNSAEEVAIFKAGLVSPKFFEAELGQYTTDYCQPMIPLVTKLWEEVFPHGQSYDYEDRTLYGRMKAVLEKARNNLMAKDMV
ncbi:MAG: hypothetical protein M1815_004670 [Lichina confinis]|nr:MAG: hypothetical protein M1815_004670 [Lichina confinis]